MSFENSPKVGKRPRTPFDWHAWVRRHRLVLLGICGLILMGNLVFLSIQVAPVMLAPEPGGVDGCIVNATGQPLGAIVMVNGLSRHTFADGCFFFAHLPPGEQSLSVSTDMGIRWTQPVVIKSGKAVGLGTLNADGR